MQHMSSNEPIFETSLSMNKPVQEEPSSRPEPGTFILVYSHLNGLFEELWVLVFPCHAFED